MKNEQSLDEIVKKVFPTQKGLNTVDTDRIMLRRNIWLKGAKYVEERSYSEEEVEAIWKFALYSAEQHDKFGTKNKSNFITKDVKEFIEQLKTK